MPCALSIRLTPSLFLWKTLYNLMAESHQPVATTSSSGWKATHPAGHLGHAKIILFIYVEHL